MGWGSVGQFSALPSRAQLSIYAQLPRRRMGSLLAEAFKREQLGKEIGWDAWDFFLLSF